MYIHTLTCCLLVETNRRAEARAVTNKNISGTRKFIGPPLATLSFAVRVHGRLPLMRVLPLAYPPGLTNEIEPPDPN